MTGEYWLDALARPLADSLGGVLVGITSYLPNVIGALLVFLAGLIVASGLGLLVERLAVSIKLDEWLRKLGVGEYVDRSGLRLDSGKFLGQIVYWVLLITFLLAVTDILKLPQLSEFLRTDVLGFVPSLIAAMLIVLVAVVLANLLRKVISASVMSARLAGAHFLGVLVWWSVTIFGLFAAMIQLGIAREIILTLITGLIAMLALAGGIAFGLGGKEYAAHLLRKLQDQVEGKEVVKK